MQAYLAAFREWIGKHPYYWRAGHLVWAGLLEIWSPWCGVGFYAGHEGTQAAATKQVERKNLLDFLAAVVAAGIVALVRGL